MNGNKKINNLKKLVVIISIAILIVAVILVMSIYNNKFGGGGGIKGGRKPGTTANTEDVIFEEDKTDKTIKINDKKNIIINADSFSDNRTVKTDSNNNIVYKTNEDNKKYVKSTIVEKDKDNNTVKEETLNEQQLVVSSEEEESVVISTTYIETLEPAVYTLTIFYKDENGNEKSVVFTFTVDEPWPEETTTTTTNIVPDAPTTTTKIVSSTKITKTRTIPTTSGTVIITQPPKSYTQITSGSSGHPNSQSDVEWAIFNAINRKRSSKPLKMAKELRTFAETNASKAVASFKASIGNGCNSYSSSACRCDIDAGKYDNVSYCANTYKSVDHAVEQIIDSNTGILDLDYEWIGIGVVYDEDSHYSWVVTVD